MPLPTVEALDLQEIRAPFDDPEWMFEVKYDGFRSLAYLKTKKCKLVSRNDHTYKRFTALRDAIPADIDADNAIIGGELVVLDDNGQSQFNQLMFNRGPPILAAFDLLYLNGEDLRVRQVAIQLESNDLPRYRKFGVFGFSSAFGEGWALYAERLADENGWYDDDLTGQLGFLQAQLFRARRLVADTGLHAEHWTRQQVIDYGFTEAETDRYIVNPGQACAYMIGQLRILQLREKAKQTLGTRFSIKEFHNVVLRGGSMPLDVLAHEIDAWGAGIADLQEAKDHSSVPNPGEADHNDRASVCKFGCRRCTYGRPFATQATCCAAG